MAGFGVDSNGTEIMWSNNVDFSGSVTQTRQITADGQLLIGSTASPNIRSATLTAGTGVSITNGPGSITIGLAGTAIETITGDTGGAKVPLAGNFDLKGTANQISVTGTANTETFSLIGPYTPATYTNHGVLLGQGTSSIVATSVGTTNTVLLGNTGSDPSFGAVSNAALVNSTVTLNNGNNITVTGGGPLTLGGTASFDLTGTTNHAVQIGNAGGSLTSTAVGTTGQVLTGVTGADPIWASPATSGTVTSVSVVSANGLAGTVATSTTTPAITLTTTITGVLSGNGTAITGSAITQYDVLVGGATNAISSVGPGSSGQILRSGGNAANPSYSTATYPATAGTSANVLTSDGTNWNSTAPAAPAFTPNSTIQLVDDFIGVNGAANITSITSSSLCSELTWLIGSSSGGSNNFTSTAGLEESGHPGVIGNTLAGASTVVAITLSNFINTHRTIVLGGGAITLNFVFKLAILPAGGNLYTAFVGMSSTTQYPSAVSVVNAVSFQYDSAINSGNWQLITKNTSVSTTTNTSTAADTNWHNFQISINAAGTSVEFFIDGVSQGTHTTNIPTAAINPNMGFSTSSVGGASINSMLIDLFYMKQTLTTAR